MSLITILAAGHPVTAGIMIDQRIVPLALVLDSTKGTLAAAPRVNRFTASGIDLQSQKVDAYWKAHLTN
jgi:hypothetical protein